LGLFESSDEVFRIFVDFLSLPLLPLLLLRNQQTLTQAHTALVEYTR